VLGILEGRLSSVDSKEVITIKLTGHITLEDKEAAAYSMLPFDVPEGIVRIEVAYSFSKDEPGGVLKEAGNILDIGIFDTRGSEFIHAEGFRGWSGSARREFHVGIQDATPGYLSGPIPAGRWEIILGLHRVLPEGCDYEVNIRLHPGEKPQPVSAEHMDHAKLREEPGWYRGELHCHTHHSEAQGSLMDLVQTARAQGLDFVAVTEHNTVSHLPELAAFESKDLLLIPGMEITTDGGHANVWGIDRWIEFRCRDQEQMAMVMAEAKSRGILISVNHPKEMGPPWTYGMESEFDCLEVWQLAWFMLNEQSLKLWKGLLREGYRITAVGGSDYHQEPYTGDLGLITLGTPCNWVFAEELSEEGILAGIRVGHVFISENPSGPRVFLEAIIHGEKAMMGDRVEVIPGTTVNMKCTVKGADGDLLSIHSLENSQQETIKGNEFVHEWEVQIGHPTYFCAEVFQGADSDQKMMRALTNPIYIEIMRT
jgi:predicted metal-dependent phosphoesterase TrpH